MPKGRNKPPALKQSSFSRHSRTWRLHPRADLDLRSSDPPCNKSQLKFSYDARRLPRRSVRDAGYEPRRRGWPGSGNHGRIRTGTMKGGGTRQGGITSASGKQRQECVLLFFFFLFGVTTEDHLVWSVCVLMKNLKTNPNS